MTRKLAVSLPDDVAERLSHEPNVSAYVAEAVRRRIQGERLYDALTNLGYDLSPEKLAAARAEREQLMANITPELRREAAALRERIKSGRPW